MKIGKFGFVLFLSVASLVGCDDGDDSPREDTGSPAVVEDAGKDSGAEVDSGSDAGRDAGSTVDSGKLDGKVEEDSGDDEDAAQEMDAAEEPDSGEEPDAGEEPDTGTAPDAGESDASSEPSAACLACEQASCKMVETLDELFDYTKFCDNFGDRLATDGPGQGRPKRELCVEYLRCARRTGCADGQYGVSPDLACFCGELPTDDCIGLASAGALPGSCALEALTAAETMEVQDLLERNSNYMNYALGAATFLLQCDLARCADECYQPCTGKADGTVCGARGGAADAFIGPGLQPHPTAGTCQAGACIDNRGILE